MQYVEPDMHTETTILLIAFAALFAAFCLFVVVQVYLELRNFNIPPGVANPWKLLVTHCVYVGISVVVSVYAICVAFACKSNHIFRFFVKFSFILQTKHFFSVSTSSTFSQVHDKEIQAVLLISEFKWLSRLLYPPSGIFNGTVSIMNWPIIINESVFVFNTLLGPNSGKNGAVPSDGFYTKVQMLYHGPQKASALWASY